MSVIIQPIIINVSTNCINEIAKFAINKLINSQFFIAIM